MSFSRFESFLEATRFAKSFEEVATVFLSDMLAFGYDRVKMVLCSGNGFSIPEEADLIDTYTPEWQSFYEAEGLANDDPVLRCAIPGHPAFAWVELEKRYELEKKQAAMMRQAEDARLYHGKGIPLWSAGNMTGGIALSTSTQALPLSDLDLLDYYGQHLFKSFQRLAGVRTATPLLARLTPRERDVLALLPDHVSDKAVAAVLGVSPADVNFHMRSLFEKFGSRNRVNLVVKAISKGIIRL